MSECVCVCECVVCVTVCAYGCVWMLLTRTFSQALHKFPLPPFPTHTPEDSLRPDVDVTVMTH